MSHAVAAPRIYTAAQPLLMVLPVIVPPVIQKWGLLVFPMFTMAVVLVCEVERVLPVTVPPVIYMVAPEPEHKTAAGSSAVPEVSSHSFISTPSLILIRELPLALEFTTAHPPLVPLSFLKFCIVVPVSSVTVAVAPLAETWIQPGQSYLPSEFF